MRRILKNSALLFMAQIGSYVIPFVELPFLARVLDPSSLGLILKCQAAALTLSLFIEYGFNFSATRKLATLKGQGADEKRLMGVVLQAKTLLSALVLLPLWAVYMAWPGLQASFPPFYAALIVLSCLAFGYSPMWYFQAKERFAFAVSCEILTRLFYLGGLLVLIRDPKDAPIVMALQVGFSLFNTMLTSGAAVKASGVVWGRWRAAWRLILQDRHLFVFKGASQMLASSTPWLLGCVSSSAAVGYYGGAEKMTRAIVGLVQPVTLASYPQFSRLFATDHETGWRLLRLFVLGSWVVLFPVMGVAYYFAPDIVRLYLGDAFGPTADMLRVLCPLVLVRVTVLLLGSLCLLPAERDKAVSQATLLSGAWALCLGGLLGYRFGGIGMAWAVLTAEVLRLGLYLWTARKVRFKKGMTAVETHLTDATNG